MIEVFVCIVILICNFFFSLNAKFGTVSVPNIALFHQSRAVVRFNSTEKSFANLVSFVKNSTGNIMYIVLLNMTWWHISLSFYDLCSSCKLYEFFSGTWNSVKKRHTAIKSIKVYFIISLHFTGLEPNETVTVTPEDLIGPLPSVATETTDYMLLVSWLFVIFCSGFMFVQSNLGQQWINKINLLWQEHQHID